MFKRPIRETVAAFPAEESQLAGLRKTVEEICLQANLTSREINNIILAIEEGATNIIRHAYMLGNGEIRLKVAIYKHHVVFSLFDTGKSFQPPDRTRLDLKKMADTGRKGGLGFYLINKVMDRVEYFSLEGENELRMTKYLSEKAEKELKWSGGISLRVKFSAWTFLIILIIVSGAYIYIDSRSTRYIQSRLDKTIQAVTNTVASVAHEYLVTSRTDAEFNKLVDSYLRANDFLRSIVIVNRSGLIVADTREPKQLYQPYDPAKLAMLDSTSSKAIIMDKGKTPYIMCKIDFAGSYQGVVILTYSADLMKAELRRTRQIILGITAVGLLIGITGIYLLSNYFVRPIGLIVSRVRKFSQGDLESQLPLTGAEEFYEISRALNELILRIRRDRKNIVEREILQKEMQMAEQIQKALIPSLVPNIEGFDIGTIYKAARMVGGDLFDIIQIDEHTFGVVVADVSGKGVPGSLVMSMVRTVMRLIVRTGYSSREALVKANEFIADDIKQGMFVTILLAVINTRTGIINFASAGHNPIIHYRSKTGESRLLNAPGMPVGIKGSPDMFSKSLGEEKLTLESNDFLLLYTDGITESRGHHNEAYGVERLQQILREKKDLSAKDVARAIDTDITRFMGKSDQHDDITMVIVKNQVPKKGEAEVEENINETKQNGPGEISSVTIKNGDHETE